MQANSNNYALIVIDLINDTINTKDKMASCAAYLDTHPVIGNTNTLIKLFRDLKLPIFFVRLAFAADYSDVPADWAFAKEKEMFRDGTWGCEIDSRVDFDTELDRVITKKRVSPFYRTTLEQELRQLDVNAIAIAGVATNNAPDLFAREAWDRDFKPTIITDACGAASDELHDTALASLPPVILKQTTQEFLGCL